MSNESLRESLSALMDDQADELELRRILQQSESDPQLRATWARYQSVRAILHKEPWQPGLDLSAAVSAAIADEPALQSATSPRRSRWSAGLGRVGVAASVTLAVLVGVRMFNQGDLPEQPALLAEQPALQQPWQGSMAVVPPPGAVLAGLQTVSAEGTAEPETPSAWQEQRVEQYLREHAEQALRAPAVQVVPYARAASLGDN